MDADIRRSGLIPVYWTLDAHADAGVPAAIMRRALGVRPGGIVLLHEGVENVVAAVPRHRRGPARARPVPGLHRGRTPGATVTAVKP